MLMEGFVSWSWSSWNTQVFIPNRRPRPRHFERRVGDLHLRITQPISMTLLHWRARHDCQESSVCRNRHGKLKGAPFLRPVCSRSSED